ncbi:MAG TPA: divalent metal cation transporter [Methylocella sp.]
MLVIVGAVAMMAITAAAFTGKPEFGNFADAGAVASGISKYAGRTGGVMFAIALIDASIIGASAVSLSTAYAIGDVLSLKHSLHRKPSDAKGFYAVYCGLIVVAAGLVDSQRAARALDQCGADARRLALAERHGVPAAAVQRQGGARSMGQHPLAQPIHRRRYCGSSDVVDHSHRLRHVPGGGQREGHSLYSWRRRHPRHSRRAGCFAGR